MDEERFFVEPFDLTDEFRRRQRMSWTALLGWVSLSALVALWSLSVGPYAMLLASVMIVAVVGWFYTVGFARYSKRKAALDKGPVEGLFRVGNGFVEYVERTKTEVANVIDRRSVPLDSSCEVHVGEKWLVVARHSREESTGLAIPKEKFVDKEAVREFLELCESRFVQVFKDAGGK